MIWILKQSGSYASLPVRGPACRRCSFWAFLRRHDRSIQRPEAATEPGTASTCSSKESKLRREDRDYTVVKIWKRRSAGAALIRRVLRVTCGCSSWACLRTEDLRLV